MILACAFNERAVTGSVKIVGVTVNHANVARLLDPRAKTPTYTKIENSFMAVRGEVVNRMRMKYLEGVNGPEPLQAHGHREADQAESAED
jgi:hypothetical protein